MSALPDPRRVLREAAERRLVCDVLLRGGPGLRGTIQRVEAGGLVLTVPDRRFTEGEDLRLRLSFGGRAYSFEACVLRIGVPVPDRSQDGLLLGYIDRWVEESPLGTPDVAQVEILPPNGPPVSLLAEPARLLDLSPRELSFAFPASYPLVFPTQGSVRLRLGVADGPSVELAARVRSLSPGEGSLLYCLELCEVDDAEALLGIIARIEAILWGKPDPQPS